MAGSVSDAIERSWDDNARAWTAVVRSGGIESRRVATDRAIIEAILEHAPARVLDVGCGEGWLCRALREKGVHCAGLDGSADLVDAARAADSGGEYHLMRYSELERLPDVAGSAFDAIVCNFSLLHEDIEPVLRSLRAGLRPGGALLIQTVHPWAASEGEYVDGWRVEDFAWSGEPFAQPMPWFFRTLESWTSTVRRCGFDLHGLGEPVHPETKRPLSLVITAVRPPV